MQKKKKNNFGMCLIMIVESNFSDKWTKKRFLKRRLQQQQQYVT